MWRERARCTGMHKHFTLNYRLRLPHANLSHRCDADSLRNYHSFAIESKLSCYFFPFLFAFAWQPLTVAMEWCRRQMRWLLLLTFNNLEQSPLIRCVNPDDKNHILLGDVFYENRCAQCVQLMQSSDCQSQCRTATVIRR